jgi:hypothetical protein
VLIYFNYLKNAKYFKEFNLLVKKANCSFNPKEVLKLHIVPFQLISIIQKECKK